MAKISLNIYDKNDKTKISKTYEADGYDLMLGTVEDFMEIIDVDKINDEMEVVKMAARGYNQLKPLLKDIFPGLTDQEYRCVKVNDLVYTIIQLGSAIVENFKGLNSKN